MCTAGARHAWSEIVFWQRHFLRFRLSLSHFRDPSLITASLRGALCSKKLFSLLKVNDAYFHHGYAMNHAEQYCPVSKKTSYSERWDKILPISQKKKIEIWPHSYIEGVLLLCPKMNSRPVGSFFLLSISGFLWPLIFLRQMFR